jgi:hypothetical protein
MSRAKRTQKKRAEPRDGLPRRTRFARGWFSVGATHYFVATDATVFPARDGKRTLAQAVCGGICDVTVAYAPSTGRECGKCLHALRMAKRRPAISARRLREMIEEATVDCYNESELISGWFTMIDANLDVPFETEILGVIVTVKRVELDRSDRIIAVCGRGRDAQSLAILDLPLPTPPPAGAEWIEAYSSWLRGG